jgi:hypothetical protein
MQPGWVLRGEELSMSARRFSPAALVAVCAAVAVLGVLAVGVGSASAAFTGYSFVGSFGPGGVSTGSFASVESVAVEQSTGDVLVLDAGTGSLYRFNAAGEPAEFPFVKADVLEGVGGAGEGLSEIAVDNSTGPAQGDIYIANEGALLIYSEAGEKLGELTEAAGAPWGIPCGVTVDAAGDVYVGLAGFPGGVNKYVPKANPVGDGDYVSSLSGIPLSCGFAAGTEGDVYGAGFPAFGGPTGVERYASSQFNTEGRTAAGTSVDGAGSTLASDPLSGDVFVDEHVEGGKAGQVAYYGSAAAGSPRLEAFGGAGEPGELTGGSYGVAVNDATGTVYASQGGGMVDVFAAKIVPDVVTGPAPRLVGGAVTLTGTVDPDGTTLTSCEFEYGTEAGTYPNKAECSPEKALITGSAPVAVTAHVTGLQTGVLYHFRLSVGNAEGEGHGQDQLVRVPPIVESESVLGVTAGSATLQAQVNPAGTSTTYHFEYDTSPYDTSAAHGVSIPVTIASIGSGITGVLVSVHVQGLAPGTVYHYRVVAGNEVQTSDGRDEVFTTQQVGGESGLPDGRQFELVSPPSKHGGEVLGLTAFDEGAIAQASEAGDAVTYLSFVPFEADAPANGVGEQYLSTRGVDGWTTRSISAPIGGVIFPAPGAGSEYKAFSADLSRGIDDPLEFGKGGEGANGERHLSPEQPENFKDIFLWDQGVAGFQPLVTKAAPGTKGVKVTGEVQFVGGSPDLEHVIFSSELALTANAQRNRGAYGSNLYEWADGAFRLVNVLPDGKTTVEESGNGAGLGFGAGVDTRNAVSIDGSRVIWSSYSVSHNLHIYESDMVTGKGVQVDAPQGGSAVASNEGETAVFDTASVDGSGVFFTSDAPLTSDAQTGRGQQGGSPAGDDLYEYDVSTGTLVDLTVDLHPVTDRTCSFLHSGPLYEYEEFCGADVQGVVGASEDGSYVYVVANGVLAAGASTGDCNYALEAAEARIATCNLYVLHFDGSSWTTRFVARVSGEDRSDWEGATGDIARSTARVSPDGRYLAFVSLASLTGYDNRDAVSDQPDTEVYLYDAGSGRLVCVSCNPTGERPTGQLDQYGASESIMDPERAWSEDPGHWLSGMLPGWDAASNGGGALHQPRYLSSEGRLFFDSTEALVPQDTNGRVDVYEFEPDGVGSCGSGGGCVYLVSGGTGSGDSTFVDATPSGSDVFFVSASQLVSQDTDNARDMYDARACAASSPCFPVASVVPPACVSADACRPGATPQPPIFGAPASATFAGPGNPAPAVSKPAVQKGKPKAKAKSKAKGKTRKRRARKRRRRAGRSRVRKGVRGGRR